MAMVVQTASNPVHQRSLGSFFFVIDDFQKKINLLILSFSSFLLFFPFCFFFFFVCERMGREKWKLGRRASGFIAIDQNNPLFKLCTCTQKNAKICPPSWKYRSVNPEFDKTFIGLVWPASPFQLDVYIAMGALYARRMSPRSEMVCNAGGQEGGRNVNPSSNRAGLQLHYHVPWLTLYPSWSLCGKADLGRNHRVHNTLHPTKCYVMLCSPFQRPYAKGLVSKTE